VAFVEIEGRRVYYEILGNENGVPIAITPGGRFSMKFPGYRELAEALAPDMKVLIWDRPNCGESDLNFTGQSESAMQADNLAALLRQVGMAPCVIAGGSGGARVSLLTSLRHPDVATALIGWNFVGGIVGTLTLAAVYVLPYLNTVPSAGMEGVAELKTWNDLGMLGEPDIKPRQRQTLLSMDPDEFIEDMKRWLWAYNLDPGKAIPGVASSDISSLALPTMIVRGGTKDLQHPDEVSREVAKLIPGAELVEPPWPDPENEWNRLGALSRQDGQPHIFETWYLLAPQILDFVKRSVRS
jgi:pimeloyl-ACP methyl ester carboxylesterase